MNDHDHIDTLAMSSYREAHTGAIKMGTSAQDCAHRYLAHMFHRDDDGKQQLAYAVLAHCCDDLKTTERPTIRWLEEVGDGYTPAAGCDRPLTGFHNHGTIYVEKGLHGQDLVRVVAHEAFHAVRHRSKGRSTFAPADERDAIEYGLKVMAEWRDAGMRVVGGRERLGLSA